VPTDPPVPTDEEHERDEGRVALWLDPEDVRWLARTCRCNDQTSDDKRERCARIRFRAGAALHKAGY